MSGPGGFPVGPCDRCGRTVLSCVAVEVGGDGARRCVHCDGLLDAAALRWVDAAGLAALGYAVRPDEVACAGSGGCGCTGRRG